MGLGSDLLKLQDFDLELVRMDKELNNLPIIAELAKKRSSYVKLKNEATKLLAQRKDAEIAVTDLDEAKAACHEAVAAAQGRQIDSGDYRQVQDLEVELGLLAKRLDKIAYDRPAALEELAQAQEKEAQLNEYIKRFEAAIIADTKSAREQASALQERIAELKDARARLAAQVPSDVLSRFERASERFKGMGVERLQGNVPSACRTSLQPASMDELRHATEIAECPYCHRILVLTEGE